MLRTPGRGHLISINLEDPRTRSIEGVVAKKFPILPRHPERTCWGCDRYCPSTDMACGNGSVRTQHPVELFGTDWETWGLDAPNNHKETKEA
jgi:hypothetical protein